MRMSVIEPTLLEKQPRQRVMIAKESIVPIESRRDPKRCREVIDCLLSLILGTIYTAKNTVRFADQEFFAFVGEEIDCLGCGFFCGIKLVVITQELSKTLQGPRLSWYVIEAFVNFQRFFHLRYPFLMEAEQPVCPTKKPQCFSIPKITPPELQDMSKEPLFLNEV